MTLHIGLFLSALYLKDLDPKVSVNQQRPCLIQDLNLLNLLIIQDLLVHQRLLHVHIEDCQEALLICDKQFLIYGVPVQCTIDALVGVLDLEELSPIRCIETFQVLIEANCENEVGLDHNDHLNDTYPMQ